jgi:hypothetical protein
MAGLLPDHYVFFIAKQFLLAAGTMLASIDEAPISMSCFIAEHVFESQGMLASRIINHYTQQVRVGGGSRRAWGWGACARALHLDPPFPGDFFASPPHPPWIDACA